MKMLREFVAGLALMGAAAVSSAPASAQQNWGGLYIGASAGWIGNDIDWQYSDPSTGLTRPPLATQGKDTGILGGHVGLQHQFGQLVAGVEVSASGLIGDRGYSSAPCFNVAFNCQARQEQALYTAGARLGWTPSRQWLLYVSGGYANAGVTTREVLAATGVANVFSTSGRLDGWYLGGGVEYAMTSNWILGLEYKHFDFGTELHKSVGTPSIEDRRIGLGADAVTLRVSYKIGRPEPVAEPMK
jgi:outer membrane immunogenic protein